MMEMKFKCGHVQTWKVEEYAELIDMSEEQIERYKQSIEAFECIDCQFRKDNPFFKYN